MVKLMRYLKKSAGYIVLIMGLLFLQAYCDLSLPDYTSRIINVGIQQGGIEDNVPQKMRTSTMKALSVFMDDDDMKQVEKYYEEDKDIYVLKDGISKDERENLDHLLEKPMMLYYGMCSGSDESKAMTENMGLKEGTDPVQALGAMPEEMKTQILQEMNEKLENMPESIVSQSAVLAVKK